MACGCTANLAAEDRYDSHWLKNSLCFGLLGYTYTNISYLDIDFLLQLIGTLRACFLRMSPRIKYPSFLFSRSTYTSPNLICITTAHLKALLRQALDQSLNTDL